MRKASLFGILAVVMLAAGCGVQTPSADTAPQTTQSAAASAEDGLATSETLAAFVGGDLVQELSVDTQADKQIVTDAVMDYLMKSTAFSCVDIDSLDSYIQVTVQYGDSEERSVYYVFEHDGKACIQGGREGCYNYLSDGIYTPLYELGMGWHTPHTMKIQSNGKNIYALRKRVWADKDGECVDAPRVNVQHAAEVVQTVHFADDFTVFIDGVSSPGVSFTLYNEDFEEVRYPVPSGLAPWSFIGSIAPGKYIAEAEVTFEDDSVCYQYLFGLIVEQNTQPMWTPVETVQKYYLGNKR